MFLNLRISGDQVFPPGLDFQTKDPGSSDALFLEPPSSQGEMLPDLDVA